MSQGFTIEQIRARCGARHPDELKLTKKKLTRDEARSKFGARFPNEFFLVEGETWGEAIIEGGLKLCIINDDDEILDYLSDDDKWISIK